MAWAYMDQHQQPIINNCWPSIFLILINCLLSFISLNGYKQNKALSSFAKEYLVKNQVKNHIFFLHSWRYIINQPSTPLLLCEKLASMASSAYSSSSITNHSANLPTTISSYSLPTKPSILTLPPLLSSSSPSLPSPQKLPLSIVSTEDARTMMMVAAESVALANAASREAVSSSFSSAYSVVPMGGYQELLQFSEDDGGIGIPEFRDWSTCRPIVRGNSNRKKRRKRSKCSNIDLEEMEEAKWLFRPPSSAYLTVTEEVKLSLHIKEGARLEAARMKIWGRNEDEPNTTEWAEAVGLKRSCLERALCRARQSKERITISYKRLVVSIAKSYQGKGLSLEDLIQEGSLGVLRGAEKFDPEKGTKLSTYVYWWIKQAIIKAIATKSRIIRLPGNMCRILAKVSEANTVLSRRLGRGATYEEIAGMLDIDVSMVRLASERSRPPISLDQPFIHHEAGRITLQDVISGPKETRPEAMVYRQLMKQDLDKLLKTLLTEREQIIFTLYFGTNGETPRSFDTIGRHIQLSRERVRQIYCVALTKLRQPSSIDGLKVYIV